MRRFLHLGIVTGLVGGLAFASLIGYLVTRPEPTCPLGRVYTYPLEHCAGWVDTGRVLP